MADAWDKKLNDWKAGYKETQAWLEQQYATGAMSKDRYKELRDTAQYNYRANKKTMKNQRTAQRSSEQDQRMSERDQRTDQRLAQRSAEQTQRIEQRTQRTAARMNDPARQARTLSRGPEYRAKRAEAQQKYDTAYQKQYAEPYATAMSEYERQKQMQYDTPMAELQNKYNSGAITRDAFKAQRAALRETRAQVRDQYRAQPRKTLRETRAQLRQERAADRTALKEQYPMQTMSQGGRVGTKKQYGRVVHYNTTQAKTCK